jgi:hypothetical protein
MRKSRAHAAVAHTAHCQVQPFRGGLQARKSTCCEKATCVPSTTLCDPACRAWFCFFPCVTSQREQAVQCSRQKQQLCVCNSATCRERRTCQTEVRTLRPRPFATDAPGARPGAPDTPPSCCGASSGTRSAACVKCSICVTGCDSNCVAPPVYGPSWSASSESFDFAAGTPCLRAADMPASTVSDSVPLPEVASCSTAEVLGSEWARSGASALSAHARLLAPASMRASAGLARFCPPAGSPGCASNRLAKSSKTA